MQAWVRIAPMKKPRSSLATVLYIFGIATALIAAFGVFGLLVALFFHGAIFIDGVASIGILVAFSAAMWKFRITWAKPAAAAILIAFVAFVAMLLDARGNYLYNQPLEWLFAPAGTHLQTHEDISHGSSSTGVNYDFRFVDAEGQVVRELSSWLVVPFRFFEYLLILSAALSVITWLRPRLGGSQWLPPPSR